MAKTGISYIFPDVEKPGFVDFGHFFDFCRGSLGGPLGALAGPREGVFGGISGPRGALFDHSLTTHLSYHHFNHLLSIRPLVRPSPSLFPRID